MKKAKFLLFAGLVCLLAVGCHKDGVTLDKFMMGNTNFKADDDSKVTLQYSSDRLLYESGDVVKVNGETFTLSKSGEGASTQWFANGNSISATEFYCAYADGVSTTLSNFSGNSYHFNLSGRLSSTTNKILLAGVTENNVLTLRPACAIIRVPLNDNYTNVKVGFERNKVYKEGTLSVNPSTKEVSISGTVAMTGVDDRGLGADFLMMEYNSTEGYWYVAVPVSSPVTTKLYFFWKQQGSGDTTAYVTSGAVTLNKGYVYTAGSSRQTPFNANGTSKCYFKVASGMTKYVSFSPGNLIGKLIMDGGAHTEWQFASSQDYYVGTGNEANLFSPGQPYDLFGYGTSDWDGRASYTSSDVMGDYAQFDLTGANANADWGVYNGSSIKYGSISSGTTWRTLTSAEWSYLINTRSNKGALATVNGKKGLILLPDLNASSSNWVYDNEVSAPRPSFTPGYSSYTTNNYTQAEWDKLEAAGVIFLPAAGTRYGDEDATSTDMVTTHGFYWSSTYGASNQANALVFANGSASITYVDNLISNGCAVRLVHQQW